MGDAAQAYRHKATIMDAYNHAKIPTKLSLDAQSEFVTVPTTATATNSSLKPLPNGDN